jgi:hypothetical protein
MRQRWVPRSEFIRMIAAGELADAHSVAAFALWQVHTSR